VEPGRDGSSRLARTAGGRALSDEAAALLRTIEERQAGLTAARSEVTRRRAWVWLVLFLTGTVVCVGGGFAAAVALARSVRRRADLLMHEADRLARGEVIEPLELGEDEIGQLAERLRLISIRLLERENELRETSHSLDRFFTVSRDLFCIAGFDGYFKRLNPAWTAALGHSLAELTSKPFIEWVHPDDRQKTPSELGHLTTGHDTLSFENRYRHADGSYRWLLWVSHPDTAAGAIYAAARDVTDHREAMARLADANRTLAEQTAQLEASNRELEAFSYSVSHDLRAPLRAIDGFSQVIDEDQAARLDDAGRDALRRVRAAAQRMGTLIDELLNLSRLSRMEMVHEPVDLSAMATAILTDLGDVSGSRCPEVHVQPGLMADGDPRMLRIAFQNLLDNAWKYTSRTADARIEFGQKIDGDTSAFYVRDNGAGFDMRFASRLFGAFQRLHTDREFQGTGVGLATVQRVIRRHGGEIWADAAPNAGATFYFTLSAERENPHGPTIDPAG
jgi:PAS domain S-box-containing protein